MPLVRTLARVHFELYQTALALLGTIAVLHILFDYSWMHSSAYGSVTIASYWAGQGVVALIQRFTRRSNARSSAD